MSLRDELIPVVDEARSLVAELGLRPRSVARILRTWSGGAVGKGLISAETGTVLEPTPKVRDVSERQSGPGGLYQVGDLLISQVSASYPETWLWGNALTADQELVYRVDGALHTLISAEMRALEWRLVLRRRR